MHQNYMAHFELTHDSVEVTIVDRDNHGEVLEGEGTCVHDAVADALRCARISFASERDERDACVAAMRSMRLSFRLLEDGNLVSMGFA